MRFRTNLFFLQHLMVFVLTLLAINGVASAQTIQSHLPAETALHDGTWLEWPHHHTYGVQYRDRLEPTWVSMTQALIRSERVDIVAYNSTEKTRITNVLTAAKVPLSNVRFILSPTDDVWVRDNGPIFVFDRSGKLKITDWGFNGWGLKAPHTLDNTIPIAVASSLGVARIDLNTTILEGGAVAVDGNGVFMATRSSILEPHRNPGLTQAKMQSILTEHFGVTKFIWLDGYPGGSQDITDAHIDGFAQFGPNGTLVTMSQSDLNYWGLSTKDINTVYNATDVRGVRYSLKQLPLTSGDVVTTYGVDLGVKGSYVNYYVANTVVLIPMYADPNDAAAKRILQNLFPGRSVIGIDCRNLYAEGGMIHCVTQQQPMMNSIAKPAAMVMEAIRSSVFQEKPK